MKSIREVLHGNLLIFTLGDVMRQLSLFITFPYFSLYVQALGGSIVEIGLVNSLRPLLALFIYPVAGFVSDKYNRAKVIATTGYVTSSIYLVFILAPTWSFLALGSLLMGLTAFTFPAMNSLMADSVRPRRRGFGYSLWVAIPSAVGIVSPYLGGYLITSVGIESGMKLLYGWTVVMTVLIATMNLKLLNDTKVETDSHALTAKNPRIFPDSFHDMFKALISMPLSLKAFALMLMLSVFFNSLAAPYWVIHGVRNIGLSELQWGMILTTAAVVNVLLLVPAGLAVDRFGAKKVLTSVMILLTLPVFLFPFSRGFTDTIVLFIIMATLNAFLISGAPTYMAQSLPMEKRGKIMSALGQGMLAINTTGDSGGPGIGAILTIPLILGSLLGGHIYHYNSSMPWLLLAACLCLNSALAAIFLSSSTDEEKS